MRPVFFGILALVIGFAIGTVAFVPEALGIKIPADITYNEAKTPLGPVTFSHKTHVEAKGLKCNACHTKVFKMKKGTSGPLTMAAMKEGKLCGACHNGEKAFSVTKPADCKKCHVK